MAQIALVILEADSIFDTIAGMNRAVNSSQVTVTQ